MGCAWGGWVCVRECIRREEDGKGGRDGRKAQKTSREGKRGACRRAAASELLSPPRTEGGRLDLDERCVASTCVGESLLAWMNPTTQWHWLLPALLFSVRPLFLPFLTLGGRRGPCSRQPCPVAVSVLGKSRGAVPLLHLQRKGKKGLEGGFICRGPVSSIGAAEKTV